MFIALFLYLLIGLIFIVVYKQVFYRRIKK